MSVAVRRFVPLIGLMVIFRLDLWEARVLFVLNWLMNMALKFALVADAPKDEKKGGGGG